MLNKENQKKAEQIAEQLRPVFAMLYKLGKIYDNARTNQHKAERIAHSWQWKDSARDWDYISDKTHTKEEREQIRAIYKENPKEWAAILENKYKIMHQAENAQTVARLNFINYINYAARVLADMIRPIWRDLVERRGLETLAEIINEKNPRKDHSAGACSVGLYLRSAELSSDHTTAGQYARIEAHFFTGWACGISGECSKVYQINPAEVWHFAELPQMMTAKTYERNKAKAAQMVAEIESKAETLREFVKSCGLFGFVEIVTINKTK